VAPPLLTNTVASALTSQAGLRTGAASLPDQFARLMDELRIIVPAVGRRL